MLPVYARVRKKQEFDQLFKKGKSVFTDFFIFKFLETKEEHTRFGVVISKKVFKKANKRNRVKRQLLAAIHREYPSIKPGTSVAIIAKQGIPDRIEFANIHKQIREFVKKAGMEIKKTK